MSDDGVRPMDFGNILDWFERHSINPLGTPFYSDDTPLMLAEYFAESFGIDWTPENVEDLRPMAFDYDPDYAPENVEGLT